MLGRPVSLPALYKTLLRIQVAPLQSQRGARSKTLPRGRIGLDAAVRAQRRQLQVRLERLLLEVDAEEGRDEMLVDVVDAAAIPDRLGIGHEVVEIGQHGRRRRIR